MPATPTKILSLNKEVQPLFDAFDQAESIVVFHHFFPDPDALGTQMGMAEFLKARYPDKTILMAGSQEGMDSISDAQMEQSLALLCDTATGERVDDLRFTRAKKIARIDHHIQLEDYGDLDYVDEKSAAAAQTAVDILKKHGETLTPKAAQHFMEALMSDTQRFTLPNVSPATFEAAAWLVGQGASVQKAALNLYSKTVSRSVYEGKVLSKLCVLDRLAIAVMSREDYLSIGLPFEDAKSVVNIMGNLDGVEIWALFTEESDGVHYRGSLRSRSIAVDALANEWHGGGHKNACGVKNLTAADVETITQQLRRLSLSKD